MTVNRITETSSKYLVDSSTSNVPAGYKKTEVGIIPEEWSFKQVHDICDFIVPGRNKPRSFDGNIPWITIPDLEGRILVNSSKMGLKISQAEAKLIGSKIVPAGSVIMSCVGELGIVAIAETEIVINQQLHAFLPSTDINNYFLACLLQSLEKYFYSVATKTTLPYLNKDRCNSTPIFIPSMEEQTAIANALSDVDALIQELEKLIAKKQAIKTATMQQLLTGRTRLPPFGFEKSAHHPDGRKKGYKPSELGEIPEDWEVKAANTFSAFITKGSTPTTYGFDWEKDGVIFLRSECVSEVGLDLSESMFISEKANQVLNRSEVRAGDILVTITGNVGRAVFLDEKIERANINQHIARIRVCDPEIIAHYVYHFLSQAEVRRELNKITTGQAYPQLSLEQVRNIKVLLPSCAEQMIIASLLAEMDSEIQTLKRRLNKTRQIKQGMMQELLTGKIRLVKPAGAA